MKPNHSSAARPAKRGGDLHNLAEKEPWFLIIIGFFDVKNESKHAIDQTVVHQQGITKYRNSVQIIQYLERKRVIPTGQVHQDTDITNFNV
jgi:hypothetical protein